MIKIDNKKSIITVNIDGDIFLYQTNLITRYEKIAISSIAENLNEFIPDASDLSTLELAGVLPTTIKNELGINLKHIGIDYEISIKSENLEHKENNIRKQSSKNKEYER